MLKQLSRLERTRSIIIIGFAVMMAVSLVIFYAPGRNSAAVAPTKSTEVLAKVGNDEITVGDLARYKEGLQRKIGGQFSLSQMGSDRQFLDTLIQGRVMAQEANRLGLGASDAEVADLIRKTFKDASGQYVGDSRYKEIVAANYGELEAFERGLRDDIARQKLQAFVTAGVRVAPEEVEDDYKRKNTTFNLSYVTVDANKLAEKIQPTEQELRAYFDQHKAEYHIKEPQKKIRYLFIDQAKAGEKLNISDDEMRRAYENLTPENKQAGVKVQQIVLKVGRPDLDATVKAKADGLVAQARGDSGNASEEKFAELARGNSEDPKTATTGGWVPFIVKKNPSKPDDPLQKTLDMQVGAVTEPTKYGNGYYIFRRGAPVEKTFEEAKKELIVSARNSKAFGEAAKLASRAAESLKTSRDFQKVAQEIAPLSNMNPAEMVKETGYIKPGDDIKDIGVSQDFERAVAALANPNDVGPVTPVKGGFAIPMLVEKKDPRDAEFDEVKEQVTAAVKTERAKGQVEQVALEIASGAGSAADLKAAAEKRGLEAKTSEAYKLGTPLGEAGANPAGNTTATDEALFVLKDGEVTRSPVKVGDNWMVLGVTKRNEADLAEFTKQRDTLTQSMVQTRQGQVFEDYINNVQARMLREGQIKINKDVLTRLEDEEPVAAPATPRMPPGFPPPSQ